MPHDMMLGCRTNEMNMSAGKSCRMLANKYLFLDSGSAAYRKRGLSLADIHIAVSKSSQNLQTVLKILLM